MRGLGKLGVLEWRYIAVARVSEGGRDEGRRGIWTREVTS